MSKQPNARRERAKRPALSVSSPQYPSGTVRARRWRGQGDVRAYRPAAGWTATADLIDIHPISSRPLSKSEWWIVETKS